MKEEIKRFRCECGATLGVIEVSHVIERVARTRILKVFAPATRNEDEAVFRQRMNSVLIEMVGFGRVRCIFCGRVREWHPMQEATEEFVEAQKKPAKKKRRKKRDLGASVEIAMSGSAAKGGAKRPPRNDESGKDE